MLDALFISDIRENVTEDRHQARSCCRDMQTALRHQRKQADGLECDRLAAGIRSGDDERPVISADRDIDRYGFFPVQQRMSGLFEVQHTVRVHLRLLCLHLT